MSSAAACSPPGSTWCAAIREARSCSQARWPSWPNGEVTCATPPSPTWSWRGLRLDSVSATTRQGCTNDLDRLPTVAAMEAWWLAADVAADTGQEHGFAVSRAAAIRLRDFAGEHRAAFERASARVLT